MRRKANHDAATVSDQVDQALAAWGNPLIDERLAAWQDNFIPSAYGGRQVYDGPVRRTADATVTYAPGGEGSEYGYGGECVPTFSPSLLNVYADCETADGQPYSMHVEVEMDDQFDFHGFLVAVVTAAAAG